MAGRIPQEFLDQLLSRVDLVELIDSRLSLRKAGRNYTACCPFHNEKTPSFSVSPEKQFYHCFGCGVHGNAIGFIMEYERLDFRDAIEELARHVGMEIPAAVVQTQNLNATGVDLYQLMAQADRFFRQQLRTHPERERVIDYLRGRGLDGVTVKDFGIGYAPPGWDNLLQFLSAQGNTLDDLIKAGVVVSKDSGGGYDRFRDRIVFPIRDRRGRTIAFGGRALDDGTPKYLNSPETPLFHKGRELYGLYEARNHERKLERLLAVEGYMDVVALAQHDIHYAVATLGTATTPEHLERLFRLTPEVVFCFDGDRAGRGAAWHALENALPLMRDGRQISFLFLPEGEDPDSLVRKENKTDFEQRLQKNALPLSDYLFQQLSAQVDTSSLDGRARLAELARPLLRTLPDSVFRELILQRLADITKLSSQGLGRAFQPVTSNAATRTGRQINDRQVKRSLPRYAIALLLARTDLAQHADSGIAESFRDVNVPGLTLLLEIIELLRTEPNLTTAMLLERYRDTDSGTSLARLAQWRPELAEELLAAEFSGVMDKLQRLYIERRLFDKAANNQLSDSERELLRKQGSA